MRPSSNDELVDYLLDKGVLKSPSIVKAMRAVDRALFVPPSLQAEAYLDIPLPIGYGQTISQPSTIVFMLELLQVRRGDKVLEVGAGSGYVASLLCQLVGKEGSVIAVERIAELVEQAKRNLAKFNFSQLKLIAGDGSKGFVAEAPYNRILISAAAPEMPVEISQQLADGGRLVVPVGSGVQDMIMWERRADKFVQQRFPGFVFVPLISSDK